ISRAVSVGSGPIETSNSWNWPGAIVPPLQVIVETAFVISPSSDLSGVASLASVTLTVQPGVGRTETEVIGWSDGRWTSSFVVSAPCCSLGTRNDTLLYE